ncbi:hypothetical protein [Longimycelium tulufanense]|uniref:hypothetical protein n=1 Tax=Longimycelium tulufanense TaxID=907463 RepID=UPI001668217E|nr:hypothetical protein [Longimycelium tulufanense]
MSTAPAAMSTQLPPLAPVPTPIPQPPVDLLTCTSEDPEILSDADPITMVLEVRCGTVIDPPIDLPIGLPTDVAIAEVTNTVTGRACKLDGAVAKPVGNAVESEMKVTCQGSDGVQVDQEIVVRGVEIPEPPELPVPVPVRAPVEEIAKSMATSGIRPAEAINANVTVTARITPKAVEPDLPSRQQVLSLVTEGTVTSIFDRVDGGISTRNEELVMAQAPVSLL